MEASCEHVVSTSKSGFVSTAWGSAAWLLLHLISFNYPIEPTNEQRDNYYNWFVLLGETLPCGPCRENFKKNIGELGFDKEKHMKSRACFAHFMYTLHNKVNTMLGKNIDITFEEVSQFYEQLRASDCSNTPSRQGVLEGGCTTRAILKPMCKIVISGAVEGQAEPPENISECFSGLFIDERCSQK